MTFNSEVIRCEWKDKESNWTVTIRKQSDAEITCHTETCDILLYATGVLNNTRWPEVEGLDKFKGKVW